MRNLPGFLLAFLLTTGCGGGGGPSAESGTLSPPPAPPPPPTVQADITLLFMGNSHTSFNELPSMVASMVRASRPGKTVAHAEAPGWMFLEERAADAASVQMLREGTWTHVVLQAQKYSSSGAFMYSTEGAEMLIRLARLAKALPILFPEWPRREVAETQRIYDLHVSIARKEPACVAPIGQAWDLAIGRHPGLTLHAADGNHSAPAGAFLAALMIATTVTGTPPDELPFIPGLGVEAGAQAQLRRVGAETVLAHHPRQWCPLDPVGVP